MQVPGLEQVPPFEHAGVQTAKDLLFGEKNRQLIILRVVHVAPVHDAVQAQVFGAVQVPLFEQVGAHIAERII